MRGRQSMAVAVRDPEGQILLHHELLSGWPYRSPVGRWPLVRGVLLLADTLRLGTRALIFAANIAARGDQPANPTTSTATTPVAGTATTPTAPTAGDEQALSGPSLWGTLGISLTFAIGLFFVVPLVIVNFLDRFIESALVSNIVEGLIRLSLLIGYLLLIGRLEDVRRVFGYHGAEHKTINAFEAGAELTPPSVQTFSLSHPRCGTGFLLVVVLFSIVVFALLGRPELLPRIVSRIVLVPFIAAIGYEYIRFTAAFYGNPLVRALAGPSLALQRLTTREPEPAMLEVAIAALQRVLVDDKLLQPEETSLDRVTAVDERGLALTPMSVSDG